MEIINLIYVFPAYLLAVGIFIYQLEITWASSNQLTAIDAAPFLPLFFIIDELKRSPLLTFLFDIVCPNY